jgi:hypothetical protein
MKVDENKGLVTLLAGKWKDKYLCKLSLLDHLRECLEKDNYLKATDTPKDSEGYKNLDKELMDTLILLHLYFDDNQELFEKRVQKFIDNLSK